MPFRGFDYTSDSLRTMTSAALYENMYKDNFSFGKNWQDFLKKLDDKKLEDAKAYLIQFIG